MSDKGMEITVYGLKEEKRIGSHFCCAYYAFDDRGHLLLCDEKDRVWAVFKDWTYFTIPEQDRRDIHSHPGSK